MTYDFTPTIDAHRRTLGTGTAALFAHGLTDEDLNRIVSDPDFMAYKRAGNGGWWREGALDEAAEFELEWRRWNAIKFGWTQR